MRRPVRLFLFSLLSLCAGLAAAQATSTVKHPAWSENATIYEANIRQHSPQGSFSKFEAYLPELKKMGVTIIWVMPINPIGEKNRKGSLGSYYAVRDYKAVNPEFGTPEDFRRLVKRAHALGMKVIIDWVANHTAWDHPWATSHPEYYTKDAKGGFVPPVPDWHDVIKLDFNNKALRAEMKDAMEYWVREFDIDGYRCDVAAMVPVDFWNDMRVALDKIKPVFMLAEAVEPVLHEKAFDMTYGWQHKDLFGDIAKGKKSVKDLDAYLAGEEAHYNSDAYRMLHITNHDLNSWEGTEFERLGDGVDAFLVLSHIMKGMPLMYSGQEAGNAKALHFFERQPIQWAPHRFKGMYSTLFALKKSNRALWNGNAGGPMVRLGNDTNVFAFSRSKGNNRVVGIFNLSNAAQGFTLAEATLAGTYKDAMSGKPLKLAAGEKIVLKPWEYRVFAR
jgi:cyclomaltodextrinase / maltogenic alpha-amylase / neopullulanase